MLRKHISGPTGDILGVAAVMCYARRGVVSQCRKKTDHAATAAVK